MKKLLSKVFLAAMFFSVSMYSFALYDDSGEEYTDTAILRNIQTDIASDPIVSNLKVSIAVRNGIVSLAGVTNTDKEAGRLIEIGESVKGVRNVDARQLKAKKSQHPLNDTFITAKVKGVFVREKLFGDKKVSALSISVETKNGIVYLTGNAESENQINTAISLARSVEGVKDVQSKVEVKESQ